MIQLAKGREPSFSPRMERKVFVKAAGYCLLFHLLANETYRLRSAHRDRIMPVIRLITLTSIFAKSAIGYLLKTLK